ncbi:hypothetical protein FO519_001759 [Halicephalobus sp. NKZ332]|nr:hypothetical protein FO519_001759 [Halicephalobus sp. NKZ332]
MSVNFQMALRSFTRSVLLRAGRNLNNPGSENKVDTNEEGDDVTVIFVMDDGTHYRARTKEGECLYDLAHRLGLEIDDPVRCMSSDPPLHYYADNNFYNNLPGPGQSKLDEELTQLNPRQRLPYFFILILFNSISCSNQTPDQPSLTFEELYKYGKNEYTTKNWSDCVAFMLRALEDYQYYVDETLWCRQKCNQQVKEVPSEVLGSQTPELVQIILQYSTTQKALCLLRCRIDKFTEERPPMSNYDVYEEFQDRKPFHYLQFCYWKMGDLKNAVSTAFTFLVGNPIHEDTVENLQFYMSQPGFEKSMMIDTLQKKYEKLYMNGVEAYENQDWMKCVEELDNSLQAFFEEHERCKISCDDYLDWGTMQGDNPEMSIVLSSIFASVLRCKKNCLEKLSKVNGHRIKNFLSSYFEYLHVCQFNLQRGRDAAQSVANALLLEKENPMMRRNRFFYSQQYNDESLFEPSEQILNFYKNRELEKRYIDFIDSRFIYVNKILPPEQADDRKPFSVEVDVSDNFDYSLMKRNLLKEKDCVLLHASAQLPLKASPFVSQLLSEVAERIKSQYGSLPKFHSLMCQKEVRPSGCRRGAFVIGVDEDRCSSFLTDEYSGCAVVYCID